MLHLRVLQLQKVILIGLQRAEGIAIVFLAKIIKGIHSNGFTWQKEIWHSQQTLAQWLMPQIQYWINGLDGKW